MAKHVGGGVPNLVDGLQRLAPIRLSQITLPFTGPRRTTLVSEPARPAAPCATDCYLIIIATAALDSVLPIGGYSTLSCESASV